MTTTDRLIAELRTETAATRRVLERVPPERYSWRPHPKSMTLGQLAAHIAAIPGAIAELVTEPVADVPDVPLPEATSPAALLASLEESAATAAARLADWGDDGLATGWTMRIDGRTMMQLPRFEMVRAVMLNHWYHHRGQLTVYLRMLGVPLPPLYGPTADENPFA
jgi:uncharacterized damage-inducible protein DinB